VDVMRNIAIDAPPSVSGASGGVQVTDALKLLRSAGKGIVAVPAQQLLLCNT
jgi:hypothetical protein